MAANGQRIIREWTFIHCIKIEQTLEEITHAMSYAPGLEDLTPESFSELMGAISKFKDAYTIMSNAMDDVIFKEWPRERKFKFLKLASKDNTPTDKGPDNVDVTGRDAADAAERFIAFMKDSGLLSYKIMIHDKSGVISHYDTIGNIDDRDGNEQRYLIVEVQNA